MRSTIIKMICGALLLTMTYTACATAQAEISPTPTPEPTISPAELRERAAKPVIRGIGNNAVEVSNNGQRIYYACSVGEGAEQLGEALPLSAVKYSELTEEQLAIFDEIVNPYIDRIKAGEITDEAATEEQLAKVLSEIIARRLPVNARSLLAEHKEATGYAEKIKPDEKPQDQQTQEQDGNGGQTGGQGGQTGGNGGTGGGGTGGGNGGTGGGQGGGNQPQPSGGGNGGNGGGNGGGTGGGTAGGNPGSGFSDNGNGGWTNPNAGSGDGGAGQTTVYW